MATPAIDDMSITQVDNDAVIRDEEEVDTQSQLVNLVTVVPVVQPDDNLAGQLDLQLVTKRSQQLPAFAIMRRDDNRELFST